MKKIIAIILLFIAYQVNAQTADSISLEKAVSIALKNNYGIVTTKRNVEIAQMNNSWGNAGALPTVKFNAMASKSKNFYEDDDISSTNLNGSVDLNWVLFRGFGIRIQKERLENMEKMSEGNFAVVVENTIFSVILSYYNVLLSNERMTIAQNTMALSEDRYKKEQYRKELGSSVTYNLLQAQNAYLRDKSDYLSAVSSYNNAQRQLNYLMAEPLENKYIYADTFEADTSDFTFAGLSEKMLNNNNTLINQYVNLELARLQVKSAQSAYYPTVSMGVSGGYTNSETDYETMNQMDRSSKGYNTSVNMSVSYTIFNGNSRKRALQAAKIEREIAAVETEEMEQDLKNQLAQELESYNVRKQILNVAAENLKAAELNLELSREKYENGTLNSFNFRDVQQLHKSASLNYQNAVFDVIQSYYKLMQLTGGIIEEY